MTIPRKGFVNLMVLQIMAQQCIYLKSCKLWYAWIAGYYWVVICISGDCIIPFFVGKKWRGLISRLFLQKRGICLPVNISSQFYNSPFLQNEIQLSIYVGKSCQWDSSNREAIFCSKNGELLPFGHSFQHKWTIIIVLYKRL